MHSNNDHASLYQNRKFYDPWSGIPVLGHDHIGHIMHYFFEDLLLYSWVSCRQTEYRVMISMDASTNVVNFMTPRAGVPVIGLFVCLFGVYHPTREFFTHMQMSPLPVKGCKF